MDFDHIVEAVRSGISDSSLKEMVSDFLDDNPDITFGEYQALEVEAGLSRSQSVPLANEFIKQAKFFEGAGRDNPQDIFEQTGLLGAGAGLKATAAATTVYGKPLTVATGGAPLAGSLLRTAPPLIRRAMKFLFGSRLRTAGTLVGLGSAAVAFEQGGNFFGDAGQGGQQPTAPGATPTTGPTPTGVPTGQIDPNTPRRNPTFNVQAAPGVGTPGEGLPSDPGFNIMVVDKDGSLTGTPGAVAIVTSAELETPLGIDPNLALAVQSQAISDGSEIAPFLQDFLNNVPSSESDREVLQVLFPETLGGVNIGSPFQVQPSVPGQRLPPSSLPLGIPESLRGEALGDPILTRLGETQRTDLTTQPVGVPAGAKLAPRIFDEFRGRTLLEWASISAQRYDVPLSLLYGLINHESGFLSTAVGDNGNSFGLAQIYRPAWPNISQDQALNPAFALEWTAQKLRERFNQFGRWDAAVAAHNSPQAAQYLAETGEFFNAKSSSYVNDIFKGASASGLSEYLFDSGADLPETAGIGPEFTPFQTPDPAQSREYIQGVYEDLLGRGATEGELRSGVGKILELSKSSYAANLKQAKGGESQAVDVNAQFEEGVKETGEFSFVEEVGDQRDFTDFASGVARLLQQGL